MADVRPMNMRSSNEDGDDDESMVLLLLALELVTLLLLQFQQSSPKLSKVQLFIMVDIVANLCV